MPAVPTPPEAPATTRPPARRVPRGEAPKAFYRVLRANVLSFVGFVLVVAIVVVAAIVAVAPHVLVPYGATQETGVYNSPPTLFRWPPSFAHPLGTDGSSLDLYSEILLALPLDLGIALAIAGVALVCGGALGLVAGYYDRPRTVGGYASVAILRTTDVFLAFPSLLLGLAIVAALGFGLWQVMVAILLTWWPYYVRLVRGEVLAVKHLPYVTAARAAGVPERRILVRHVLRNVLEPIVVYFTLDVGTVLVTFSTIAFVIPGVVAYPQPPEWGSMLSFFNLNYPISQYWWEVTFPSVAIFVTALSFSLLGDGLRDVLDPRSRRALTVAVASSPPAAGPVGPDAPAGRPVATSGATETS
jgi:peptide/nickel transport system permease protein